MNTPPTTVCIIDDDASVREALARVCRSAGLAAMAFATVDEFLAAELPDGRLCVVTDIAMPGTPGTSLPARLRERGLEFPVIFITGHHTPEAHQRAYRAGAVGYFRKPVDDQALLDAIAYALCKPEFPFSGSAPDSDLQTTPHCLPARPDGPATTDSIPK